MRYDKLDNLPILNTFKYLKRFDKVYSEKHGIGTVMFFHNDEIVVAFKDYRKRLSTVQDEVAKIPEEYFKKPKNKVEVTYYGYKTSLREYKKDRREEKKMDKKIDQYIKLGGNPYTFRRDKQLEMYFPSKEE